MQHCSGIFLGARIVCKDFWAIGKLGRQVCFEDARCSLVDGLLNDYDLLCTVVVRTFAGKT